MTQTPDLPELWWSHSDQMVYRGEHPRWFIGVTNTLPDEAHASAVRLGDVTELAAENERLTRELAVELVFSAGLLAARRAQDQD